MPVNNLLKVGGMVYKINKFQVVIHYRGETWNPIRGCHIVKCSN